MPIYMRICFLCYQDGKTRKAVGYYIAARKVFDVCREHRGMARDQGMKVLPIKVKDRIMEV